MRSLGFAVALAAMLVAADASAVPPYFTVDSGRSAGFWLELTQGPFAAPGDAPVLKRPNPFAVLPKLGTSEPTRGFYLWGTDALHVVPRRVGCWGWGLMAGGEF